ncbi:MAG: hypothetical protein QE280_10475 [Caulobacter sp.]|nr:hypothetical protein [Caulobacter sp.]
MTRHPVWKDGYDRGRRDERARRRRSPLLVLVMVLVAIIGGVSLVFAAREGSFREGGAMMDAGVSKAARESGPALRRAADEASQGLRKAQQPAASPDGEPVPAGREAPPPASGFSN